MIFQNMKEQINHLFLYLYSAFHNMLKIVLQKIMMVMFIIS